VGQLVAESIRLYGRRFWPSLVLGVGPAAVAVLLLELPRALVWALLPVAGTAAWAAAFVGAVTIALDKRTNLATAFAAAFAAFLPLVLQRIVVVPGFDLVTLAYFGLVSLAVPAAVAEGLGLRASLRRGFQLARADFVHALGSLATLVITIVLTGLVLVALLHGFGDQALRVAAVLAFVVLSPLFLLGAAMLYFDQAARVKPGRRTPVESGNLRPRMRARP
jgi:hypothetical protein